MEKRCCFLASFSWRQIVWGPHSSLVCTAVRDDQPHLPLLLRKQLPLPNPSKSPSTDSVICAMVLPEKYQTKTSTSVSPDSSECPLSSAGCGSGNFPFHLVFFPAASLLYGERLRVVAAVAWIA